MVELHSTQHRLESYQTRLRLTQSRTKEDSQAYAKHAAEQSLGVVKRVRHGAAAGRGATSRRGLAFALVVTLAQRIRSQHAVPEQEVQVPSARFGRAPRERVAERIPGARRVRITHGGGPRDGKL